MQKLQKLALLMSDQQKILISKKSTKFLQNFWTLIFKLKNIILSWKKQEKAVYTYQVRQRLPKEG